MRRDCIQAPFARLRAGVGITKSVNAFRKMVASKLAEHPSFACFVGYYLGDAPNGMADWHYLAVPTEQFGRAIAWLGAEFGVE